MIKVITFKDIGTTFKLFIGQYQLRYREFMQRQNYAVKSMDGLEWDNYDAPAAVYLVYTDDGRQVLGVSRLAPIEYGCMLADHFPELVDDKTLFDANGNIWESTRFCIDHRLPAAKRQAICHALVAANIEFGLSRDVERIIGVMPTIILRTVFERSGVLLDRLGPVQHVGDHNKVQAAAITISKAQWERVKAVTGLSSVIIDTEVTRRKHVA
ncbi:MAG: acyl-homoserine-lactone synthase [Asticcacaulis sp.]|uniref:acyl-homoserine-lactone synthase n=1 Tax=Asticcacaulis sp. TaxID=1872648 RepID=UPI0039E571F6